MLVDVPSLTVEPADSLGFAVTLFCDGVQAIAEPLPAVERTFSLRVSVAKD